MSPDGNLLRSKNVSDVDRLDSFGAYCVDPGSGINPATAVMVVGEDGVTPGWTSDPEDNVSHVEWVADAPGCPAGTMEVRTFVGYGTRPSFNSETDVGGFDLFAQDQSFSFVIP